MRLTWLGQAGYKIETEKTTLLIDPYFSDSAASVACHRKQPVDRSVWEIEPDIILITHDHIDHNDKETLKHFINENTSRTVLSPKSVRKGLAEYKGNHNLVEVSDGVVWTNDDVVIKTVSARHSDEFAVGFIIETEGKNVYHTGDTLYCPSMLKAILNVDAVILPINGRGNNMNAEDARKFAADIDASLAIPMHFGMLDDIDPHIFTYKNTYIPEIYREFEL